MFIYFSPSSLSSFSSSSSSSSFLCILISHVSFTSHYSSLFFLILTVLPFFLSFFRETLRLAPAMSLHLIAVLGFSSPRKRVKLRQAHWDLFTSLNFLYLFLILLCIPFLYSFLVLHLKDECPASARFHRLGVEADIRTRATLAREHLQTRTTGD